MNKPKEDLLRKIKALADRGVGGEKENAQRMLAHLMQKYGITENDLDEERVDSAYFRYSQEWERRILNQVIFMVTGSTDIYRGCSASGRKIKEVYVYCTTAQRLEIEATYSFFRSACEKDLDIFIYAFISNNHIFPPDVRVLSDDDLSPEELERSRRAGMMCAGMDVHTMRKAIEGDKP